MPRCVSIFPLIPAPTMQTPDQRQETDEGKTGGGPGDHGNAPNFPEEAAKKNANHPSDAGSGIEAGHHRCPRFGHQLGTEGKTGNNGELKGKEDTEHSSHCQR